MKSATLKTEPPPATQLRKAGSKGSPMNKNNTTSWHAKRGLHLLSFMMLCARLAAAEAIIITSNIVVTSSDMSYEHADLLISNATLTVRGNHQFGLLNLTNQGVVSVEGGSLACVDLAAAGSTCWLRSGASLTSTSSVSLFSNSDDIT